MFVRLTFLLIFFLGCAARRNGDIDEISSKKRTRGQPWPMPQSMSITETRFAVHRESFSFHLNQTNQPCDLISNAFDRYYRIIFVPETTKHRHSFEDVPLLKTLQVNIQGSCERWPRFESNESYTLLIENERAVLNAVAVWGALRGIETFSQLIYSDDDLGLAINGSSIVDYPRFQHRGLLFDTSTHFVSLNTLKLNLEAMAQSKFNVFHFHIVDDQSFPYDSLTFPQMSQQGAYDQNHVYSQTDIAELVEFARQRGIRVFVEFDSPGHTRSWGKTLDILTRCYSGGQPTDHVGPMDPSRNSTFDFLKNFFTEVAHVFPDQWVHLGGDEVDFDCWENNPFITDFMRQMGFGTDYSLLEQYYMERLIDLVRTTGKGYAIWQEVIDNNVTVRSDTIVQVWKEPYREELAKVTSLGYRTLLSTCWYLNLITYGKDWKKYYECEPLAFHGTDAQKKLVIGGEACMWGEYVDTSNIITSTWPRAAAAAERLWSAANVNDTQAAAPRFEEHRCRYLRRGIPAAPANGPGFCPIEAHGYERSIH